MYLDSEPSAVICGSLIAASRYIIPDLPLFGCNGHHLAVWLTRGHLSVVVNGERRTITAQTAVLIAADAPKSIEPSSGAFGSIVAIPASPEFRLPMPLVTAKIPNIGAQQRVSALLDQLQGEVDASDTLSDDAANYLAKYLFIHLIRLADTPASSANSATSSQQLMTKFSKLLEQGFRSGRLLSDYANDLGVTTTHLTRISRTLNEQSANKMIQDRVFSQARFELATGAGRINQIGSDLGFKSAAYFTRLFAEKNGLPPREYRARHLARTNASTYALKAAE